MSEIWMKYYEAALANGDDEYTASVIADHMAREEFMSAVDAAEYLEVR